ncbi:MAG: hypothetical protein HZB85_06200 [Deltaproteobacteria bacterium]|nr:hypothetical protein [Deltaproteobacteria bacterium]
MTEKELAEKTEMVDAIGSLSEGLKVTEADIKQLKAKVMRGLRPGQYITGLRYKGLKVRKPAYSQPAHSVKAVSFLAVSEISPQPSMH